MGHDRREALAYAVAKYSILNRTIPNQVNIIPLKLTTTPMLTRSIEQRKNDLGNNQLWCPISDSPMSTEFAISRFAVPFLQPGGGWALFMDCDMVCLGDIRELFEYADSKYAIQVVKHKHEPTEEYHDAGLLQTLYKRKNWSSVMLWNLDHPSHKNLTIEKLNTVPGRNLHAFDWLQDDEIGELPQEWNFLVGVNEGKLEDQKMLHYTNGQPGWSSWIPQDTDYIFNEELKRYNRDICSSE